MNKLIFPPTPKSIRDAAKLIGSGSLVAFPTETVYGLGANALNARAVDKIFQAKGRPSDNPLIVHVANVEQLQMVAKNIPAVAKLLMKKFWPGPLTFVLQKKATVPTNVTAGGTTVAVRMPSHPVALKLIRQSGCPVAAPSANLSGKPSPTTSKHVAEDFSGKIPMILDGGNARHGLESTVIDVTGKRVEILRSGAITPHMLQDVLGYLPEIVQKKKGQIRSPGLKYQHYAPSVPMILMGSHETHVMIMKLAKMVQTLQKKGLRVGVLCVREHQSYYRAANKIVVCGSRKNPASFGRSLYGSLRKFSQKNCDILLAEHVGSDGVAHAIYDRLTRAAEEIM